MTVNQRALGSESGHSVPVCCPADRSGALSALAGDQHAVFSLEQFVALGFTADAARKRVGRGTLYRVFPRILSLVPAALLSLRGKWMAAVLACGAGARLSHRDCATLQDVRWAHDGDIDVTVPRETMRKIAGIRQHRARDLRPEQVTIIDGIPCTTLARTIFDCASCLSPAAVKSVLDAAERRHRFDQAELLTLLEGASGYKGTGVLRQHLAEGGIGDNITRNELEERFEDICRRRGLPFPLINGSFQLEGRYVYPDFFWPQLLAAVETDGAEGHSSDGDVRRDYERARRLERAGVTMTRFSRNEIFRRTELVGNELTAFLAVASRTFAAREPLSRGRIVIG